MSPPRLDLGVGVIATAGLDVAWDEVADLVDVIEVEPQTLWTPRPDGGWDVDDVALGWIHARDKPTLTHGVGFPVGGCHPPDPRAVALAADCAERLGAVHFSEHLSYNRVSVDGDEFDAGFLLPPAQTDAGVAAAIAHIGAYQNACDKTFLIETGVNYLQPVPGELSDGRFIAAIVDRADCGILLDLHNLLTNQRNGRQCVADVLDELPLDRVYEIHVAGGFPLDGYYLDAHIGGPDAELLALLGAVLPRLPNVRAVIFEAMPESMITLGPAGLRAVLESLHQICAASRQAPNSSAAPGARQAPSIPPPGTDASDHRRTREQECRLAAYTARITAHPPGPDPGYLLLRTLADAARLGQLARARPDLLHSLVGRLGVSGAERVLENYLDDCPPQRWTDAEGTQFDRWLRPLTGTVVVDSSSAAAARNP